MELKQLKKRVLSEVMMETLLARHFGYQENGGRCPMCGTKHCIRAIEYDPGVNGFECQTCEMEGTVIHLFNTGAFYPADLDPSLEGDPQMGKYSEEKEKDNILDMASLYLGTGEESGQLCETDPSVKNYYEMMRDTGDVD